MGSTPVPGSWQHGVIKRAAGIAALALPIGLGIAMVIFALPSLQSNAIADGKDLTQEYHLTRALLEGSNPYASGYLTAHPPTAGLLFLPLALVQYPTAATIWFGLEIGCLILSVYMLGQDSKAHVSLLGTLAVTGLLLAWHPVVADLTYGQLGLVQLPFLAIAWRVLQQRRDSLAGLLIGIAFLIKPFLWPLALFLLLQRNWRTFGSLTVTVLLGYCITVWRIGYQAHLIYFTRTLPEVSQLYKAHVSNISLWSLGWRLFDGTGIEQVTLPTAPPLVRNPTAAQFVSIAIPLLTMLTAYLAVRRIRRTDEWFGLAICVSILVSPIAWTHYMTLATIPAAQAIRWLADRAYPRGKTVAAMVVGGLLLLPPEVAARLTYMLAPAGTTPPATSLPFLVALSQMEPALAVAALAWLVATLQMENETAGV